MESLTNKYAVIDSEDFDLVLKKILENIDCKKGV
jgi:hypothetical protein